MAMLGVDCAGNASCVGGHGLVSHIVASAKPYRDMLTTRTMRVFSEVVCDLICNLACDLVCVPDCMFPADCHSGTSYCVYFDHIDFTRN